MVFISLTIVKGKITGVVKKRQQHQGNEKYDGDQFFGWLLYFALS
jgi:hypothetical protein